MRSAKRWHLLAPDPIATERLSRELSISPVLAQLLLNRNVAEAESARRFLEAKLTGLHDPELLPGVAEAAKRLHQAIQEKRRICVYGDYDVDGITGTTLLWRCLQLAGAADADYYVPDRMEEGYGLNLEALRKLHRSGFQVIVTVDCGITSIAEAALAKELGLELIVTDHHEFKATLPDAAVLVHPRLPGSSYPFQDLCGAGVAFKLAWAICQQFSQAKKVSDHFKQFLLESVALVAMGTVADVVPLLDENRIFVRHGLKSLREAPTIGLRSLLQAANLTDKELDAGHIGFTLAPRINAAGRLGQARLAVELLATSSEQRANDLARYLNEQNELRQKIEGRIFREARELAEANYDLDKTPALVLASEDWHPGVIGIVAGRLVERYARPVLLISLKDQPGQGSGRSIPNFNLNQTLTACTEYLLSHGGHAMAAGFKIDHARVAEFREVFCKRAGERMNGTAMQHTITIDAEVPLSALTLGLVKSMHGLHPNGQGNRRPVFLTGNLQIQGQPRLVGQSERHVNFSVRQQTGPSMRVIAFGMADRLEELMSQSGQCCLVYTPKINEWQGQIRIDLEVADLQAGPVARLE